MLRRLVGGVMALALGCAILLPGTARAEEEGTREILQIGIIKSLFRDMPPTLMQILSRPLKALMDSQTGCTGNLQCGGDACELAQAMKEHKIHLGVYHGFEFAWARQKNPDLKPLVIAICRDRQLHALLVVRKDSELKSCADLKGKAIGLPRLSREHCHLFLERRCPGGGEDPTKYFSSVKHPSSAEDALDDVGDGLSDAAIVDRVAYDQYVKEKPGRAARLRVLIQSEPFPAAVIAYQAGTLKPEIVRRFREGMVAASKNARGQELLKLCRITSFEPVPADFDDQLIAIIKAYPPPVR